MTQDEYQKTRLAKQDCFLIEIVSFALKRVILFFVLV
jgi:hypothetical protein